MANLIRNQILQILNLCLHGHVIIVQGLQRKTTKRISLRHDRI